MTSTEAFAQLSRDEGSDDRSLHALLEAVYEPCTIDIDRTGAVSSLRSHASAFAKSIVQNVPPSPDRTVALRYVRNALREALDALR